MSAPCHIRAIGPSMRDVCMKGIAAAYARTNAITAATASSRFVGSSTRSTSLSLSRLARPRDRPELPSRGDAELDEDLPQVPFDGVRADEQLRADLLIRQPVTGQPRDLCLLGGQLVTRADRLLAYLFAGGDQLAACPFSEGVRAHRGVHLVALTEMSTRVEAPVDPAQPLAIVQASARGMHDNAGRSQSFNGVEVQVLGTIVTGHQGFRICQETQAPVCSAGARAFLEPLHGVCSGCHVTGARRRFSQLEQTPTMHTEVLVLTTL